ncbi:MAG: ligase-associated DNA damage response endonuclease PdeM [Chitinophagaceae bacterium]
MTRLLSHIIHDEHFVISSERTLFWENQRALIVADLHVGKTGHFRKSGISVPQSVYKDDLHRLLSQILFFKAEKLIIAGDLTHSVANLEMDLFRKWRNDFPMLDVHLAKGNHDILDNKWYAEANIQVHNDPLEIGRFSFIHDISDADETPNGPFIFSGHVHPTIVLRGKAKQTLCFPCFYFTNTFCILPAFSRFTGGYRIEPQRGDKVFAIAEKEILAL